MLTTNQLRRTAKQSGARDIVNVEIDVILTHLLQLFYERGITEHVAFKGGTMLRKMLFGPRGRLSTDLDFTRRSNIPVDDLMIKMMEALEAPYRGISFGFEKDKDWYITEDGCSANPVCTHAANTKGVKIKLQVSIRESPILPVVASPQIEQPYFQDLDFGPSEIPCLALEEAVAEKIRAASQRSKIRDLHDLSELADRPLNRELIRTIAVRKLWNSGKEGLDYERFRARIADGGDYDIADLTNLLRKDQRPDLKTMIARVVDGFRFLGDLTPIERAVAADTAQQRRDQAEDLIAHLLQPVA